MHKVSIPGRIHSIHVDGLDREVFVYRDDEAGFAISGAKRRKYEALVPWLTAERYQQVAVIGSLHSNNVLAAAQYLTEARLKIRLFLKEGHHGGPGNAFLTELLVPRDKWEIVANENWGQVEVEAGKWAQAQTEKTFVLTEGAFCEAAFRGVQGLAKDVHLAARNRNLKLGRVYLDAGTGLTAAGMLWADTWPKTEFHIVRMAMPEGELIRKLKETGEEWEGLAAEEIALRMEMVCTHTPFTARSYGAINTTVLKTVLYLARRYGMLTDPIYTAKLFGTAFDHLRRTPQVDGVPLIVHSGGAATLAGFYDRLKPLL